MWIWRRTWKELKVKTYKLIYASFRESRGESVELHLFLAKETRRVGITSFLNNYIYTVYVQILFYMYFVMYQSVCETLLRKNFYICYFLFRFSMNQHFRC